MAATHLTLEEAAEQLGLTPDEFKKRLKTDPAFKVLVPIRDGATLRFKPAAVEELARQLGQASNPELPLADLAAPPADSDAFKVTPVSSRMPADEPLVFSESDDVFSLSEESPPPAKKPGSDSDIRLDSGKPKKPKEGSDAAGIPTEEIAIDVGGPGSAVIKGGSSSKLSAPKSGGKLSASDSGQNLANPGTGDSSEFELSLDADSDDFELKLNTEASDEVALGEIPKDVGGKRGGESGINLRDPADSGISLEKGQGKEKGKAADESDSDVDFELTLDSSSASPGVKLGNLKGPEANPDSDSEFELTLDDSGSSDLEHAALAEGEGEKRDIFETDFEIPPMEGADSGSEVVALEDSDTDLERADVEMAIEESDVVEDTSGSEVVLLDDEEAPARGKGRKAKAADVDLADVEEEDDASVSKVLRGAKGRRKGVDEDEEEEEEVVPAGAVARPQPWGPLPALILLPTMLIMLLGALMGYEILQTMWGYQQPRKPAAPIVRELAKTLDMPLADQ